MHFGNRLRAVALAFVVPFAIVACGPAPAAAAASRYCRPPRTPPRPRRSRADSWSTPTGRPSTTCSGSAPQPQTISQATTMLWLSLWTYDPTNVPVPDLVQQVPATDNGGIKVIDATHMDMTVNLKSGLKWSDGSPLTSDDVIFTWKAICDPAAGYPSTAGYDHVVSIDKVSDTQTVWHFGPETDQVRDRLDRPAGLPLRSDRSARPAASTLRTCCSTWQVFPKSALGSIAHADWAKSDYFNVKPTVTSGPYMVDSFTPGNAALVIDGSEPPLRRRPQRRHGLQPRAVPRQGDLQDLRHQAFPDRRSRRGRHRPGPRPDRRRPSGLAGDQRRHARSPSPDCSTSS